MHSTGVFGRVGNALSHVFLDVLAQGVFKGKRKSPDGSAWYVLPPTCRFCPSCFEFRHAGSSFQLACCFANMCQGSTLPTHHEPRPPSTKLNGSFGWEGSGSTRIVDSVQCQQHSGLRMHAAKPASLQTAQRQAYRVFARCPRSLTGPSRRGGGSHCVPFMVDLKPPDSSITSEVSTLRTRVDMQMPSHPLPYLPAAGRCAIRHPPSAMPTEAPASISTMRAIPGLVRAPCLEFTVFPASHLPPGQLNTVQMPLGAARLQRKRPALSLPWHFCARTRPLQSMPDLARPCRIIQHTGPHGANRPGRGVCHNRNPSAMSSPASLCLVSSSTPLW